MGGSIGVVNDSRRPGRGQVHVRPAAGQEHCLYFFGSPDYIQFPSVVSVSGLKSERDQLNFCESILGQDKLDASAKTVIGTRQRSEISKDKDL
jgi:hypothetical protein